MGKEVVEVDDPLIGTTIADRYEVKSRIARGGMSHIYHAVQLELGRDVALKVMHAADDEDTASEFARRMLNEAAGAAKLKHPNTIVIHDYGHLEDGRCFIAMELLEGRTLLEEIDRAGPLDPGRAIHIALQITGSLAEAHDAGMIHRDLKPGNVMLLRRGADEDFVKVVDFGLVKHDAMDDDVEASGALVGTPRYMAPEQVIAEAVSAATDVYGLGATLYHTLTGRPPFESDSRFVLMAAHITTQPRAMSEVLADQGIELPPAIEAVVMRCLRKDAFDRYQNMPELAEALADALGEEAPSTMRASLPSVREPVRRIRSKSESSEIDALADAMGETGDDSASSPGVWIALCAVALFSAGAAVWLAMGGAEEASEPDPPVAMVARPEETEPVAEPPDAHDVPVPEPASVVITTVPEHATLRRGDADLGDGPLTLEIPAGEEWTIEVRSPGYANRTITLTGAQRQVSVYLTRRRGRPSTSDTPESTRPPPRSDNRDPWAEENSSGSR